MRVFSCCVLVLCWNFLESNFAIRKVDAVRDVFREKRSEHGNEEEGHGEDDDEGDEEHHEDHTALINSLFFKYDSSSSPTHGTSNPTEISVNVQVLSMDDINDAKMEYTIDTRVTFFWFDHRLMTPECRDENKDCDDHFDLKKRMDALWMPDLYIINSRLAKQHDQPLRNGMLYLIATGKVLLSKRLTLTLRCPMDLILYPLDTQKCPLLICPYSLTENELVLKWAKNGVGIMDAERDGQNKFRLQRPIQIGNMKLKYDGPDVSGSFSCVNATFTMKRSNGYHMGYSYTITSFIVFVSWISFWLPVTAVPARITLGVTTLLTLLTTANFVRASLPPISYVTAIDVWVGLCTAFVLLVLLLFPVAHHYSSKNQDKHQKVINVNNRIDPSNTKCGTCGGKKIISQFRNTEKSVDVDKICRQIFPFMFIIFNVAYWWYYLTRN